MNIKSNIHILPTKEKTSLIRTTDADRLHYNLNISDKAVGEHSNSEYVNIYFTLPQSDLEVSKIEEGDWCIDYVEIDDYGNTEKQIYQKKKGLQYADSSTEEKVIACTDESLSFIKDEKYPNGNNKGIRTLVELPIIPESFIEYFVFNYNNSRKIKQIKIKLDEQLIEYIDETNNSFHGKNLGFIISINEYNEICIEEDIFSKHKDSSFFPK